jgi:hypothetical protein
MATGRNHSWSKGDNTDQLSQTRYAKGRDISTNLAFDKAGADKEFADSFLTLNKSIDGTWLNAYDHRIPARLSYGVDHYKPLPTTISQYFGTKTGGGHSSLAPMQYPKRYSAYGE